MEQQGILRKMHIESGTPAQYYLRMGEATVDANELLGQRVTLHYTGNIFCVQCGRKTKKSFQQGHCYPCFMRLQECGCQVKPELCKIYEGLCKQDDWAHEQCFGRHIVYFANSSGLKVGITREQNVPSRWLDQGAVQALPVFQVENRYQSGLVEVCLKDHMKDKTNWRVMLKGSPDPVDLIAARDKILNDATIALKAIEQQYPGEILRLDPELAEFNYPVNQYPEKIKSYNFDKIDTIDDTLMGLKGQYLIFEDAVINVRKFSGYEVRLIL